MRNTVFLSFASLLLVGCSQDLSDEDARVAWASTNVALAQGSAQAQVAASGTPATVGENTDLRPRAAAAVDYTWSCTGGGTAKFVGSAEVLVSDTGSSDVKFDLATDFDGCSVNKVTITGSLDYAASVSASGDATGGTATTTLTMKGSLSYEGEVEGSCDIDMTASVSAGGTAGGGGFVSASYDGSICGHDASATLNVQG